MPWAPESARIPEYPACHHCFPLHHVAPGNKKVYWRLLYNRRLVPARKIIKDLNQRYGDYGSLAVNYVCEDLLWRHRREPISWLQKEIRL